MKKTFVLATMVIMAITFVAPVAQAQIKYTGEVQVAQVTPAAQNYTPEVNTVNTRIDKVEKRVNALYRKIKTESGAVQEQFKAVEKQQLEERKRVNSNFLEVKTAAGNLRKDHDNLKRDYEDFKGMILQSIKKIEESIISLVIVGSIMGLLLVIVLMFIGIIWLPEWWKKRKESRAARQEKQQ